MLYIPSRNLPYGATLAPGNPMVTDFAYTRPASVVIQGPRGLPINKPPWSVLTAIDMNKGEHVWQVPIGGAPDSIRNNPALKGLNLDFDHMGKWNIRPGILATKTLVFMGEAGGYGDPGGPMFRAYDKKTGQVVSEIELPSLESGAPMTYVYKGHQYIVVTVSSEKHPAELVALALPDGRAPAKIWPAPDAPVQPAPAAVPARGGRPAAAAGGGGGGATAAVADGRQLFATACAGCHGVRGQGTPGETPGVANITDYDTVLSKVTNGGFSMPSLQGTLTDVQMAAVSRYVASGGLKASP
jgi:quinoprotein glucose dehydrogenase